MSRLTMPCIACGRELKQVEDDAPENQPYGATEFRTHGHYGSTAYDPMDGHYIVVNICDLCLVTHADRVREGRDRRPVLLEGVIVGWDDVDWKPVHWRPKPSEVDWVIEQTRKEFDIGYEPEDDE